MGMAWMRLAQLTVQPTVQLTIMHMQPTVVAPVQSTVLPMTARLARVLVLAPVVAPVQPVTVALTLP